jgi:hypothetical protein
MAEFMVQGRTLYTKMVFNWTLSSTVGSVPNPLYNNSPVVAKYLQLSVMR